MRKLSSQPRHSFSLGISPRFVSCLGISSFLFTRSIQSLREPYRNWAEGHIQRIKAVLDNSRAEHTQAVKDRIASVAQMKDVVSLTQGLFQLSKVMYIVIHLSYHLYLYSPQETARIESEEFVQLQKVAMASELKAVLDSWVRYEQQLKESEQADLVKSVMNKVNAGLKDERTQREILNAALAEVECEDPSYFFLPLDPVLNRPLLSTGQEQGHLDVVLSFSVAKHRQAVLTRQPSGVPCLNFITRLVYNLTFPSSNNMDSDLITLVNKLQDTFSNLGQYPYPDHPSEPRSSNPTAFCFSGGDLDMPQLVVVCAPSTFSKSLPELLSP